MQKSSNMFTRYIYVLSWAKNVHFMSKCRKQTAQFYLLDCPILISSLLSAVSTLHWDVWGKTKNCTFYSWHKWEKWWKLVNLGTGRVQAEPRKISLHRLCVQYVANAPIWQMTLLSQNTWSRLVFHDPTCINQAIFWMVRKTIELFRSL